MIEVEIGGRVLGVREFSRPTALTSALRGPTPGSREVGSASLTIFHIGGRPSWLVLGAEVAIRLDGAAFSRGVIDTLRGDDDSTAITTKELAARTNEIQAGMLTVVTQPNPELEVWVYEGQRLVYQPTERALRMSVPVFEVLPLATQFTRDPWDPERFGYRRELIFDSYRYSSHTLAADHDAGRRTLQWDEWPLATVVQQARALCLAEGLPTVSAAVTTSTNPGQIDLPVRDDNDEILSPEFADLEPVGTFLAHGVCTRVWDGQAHSYVWRERIRDADNPAADLNPLELFQLVNHSLARRLGVLDPRQEAEQRRVNWLWLFDDQWRDREGPFVVQPLYDGTIWPHLITFYWLAYRNTIDGDGKTEYRSRALVLEVDLRTVADSNGEELLGRPVYLEAIAYSEAGRKRFVLPSVFAGYVLEDSIGDTPQRETESVRTDGVYRWTGGAPLRWEGALLLSEVAYEFENATVRDVLRNLSLVSGCEWWVDGAGVLRMEPLEGTARTVTVNDARHVSSVRLDDGAEPDELDETFDGIPLSALYRRELNRELQRRILQQASERQVTTALLSNYTLELGSQLTVNETPRGRLVRIEAGNWPLVSVETEQ